MRVIARVILPDGKVTNLPKELEQWIGNGIIYSEDAEDRYELDGTMTENNDYFYTYNFVKGRKVEEEIQSNNTPGMSARPILVDFSEQENQIFASHSNRPKSNKGGTVKVPSRKPNIGYVYDPSDFFSQISPQKP